MLREHAHALSFPLFLASPVRLSIVFFPLFGIIGTSVVDVAHRLHAPDKFERLFLVQFSIICFVALVGSDAQIYLTVQSGDLIVPQTNRICCIGCRALTERDGIRRRGVRHFPHRDGGVAFGKRPLATAIELICFAMAAEPIASASVIVAADFLPILMPLIPEQIACTPTEMLFIAGASALLPTAILSVSLTMTLA